VGFWHFWCCGYECWICAWIRYRFRFPGCDAVAFYGVLVRGWMETWTRLLRSLAALPSRLHNLYCLHLNYSTFYNMLICTMLKKYASEVSRTLEIFASGKICKISTSSLTPIIWDPSASPLPPQFPVISPALLRECWGHRVFIQVTPHTKSHSLHKSVSQQASSAQTPPLRSYIPLKTLLTENFH